MSATTPIGCNLKFDRLFLVAKTPTAQVNEVLCKVLCHNICVLIQSMYELGIEPVFELGTFGTKPSLGEGDTGDRVIGFRFKTASKTPIPHVRGVDK